MPTARLYKPFGPEVAERIVALTLAEPPGETTHWTGRAMAKITGVSLSYVQRVWRSHGLQPHRIRPSSSPTTHSSRPRCATSSGLEPWPRVGHRPDPGVDPPAHAVVLSVDEKRSHGEWIATDALTE